MRSYVPPDTEPGADLPIDLPDDMPPLVGESPDERCLACGGAHHIQRCGAIRAALFRQHPLAPPPMGYEYARLLAHRLNVVASEPAHVVNLGGHLHLTCESDLAAGMWPREAVVYTADCSEIAAL